MASFPESAVSFTGTTAQNTFKPLEGIPGRDSLTAVAAMQMPATKSQHSLPTPPNSISPNLPPHGLKAARGKTLTNLESLDHVDSDLDLQDGASESLVSLSRDAFAALSPDAEHTSFDIAGNITPALLAKHHLPEILLNNGPLAIRHVMGFLTTSVPGFSGIPPAKARRLVVGALEGRGGNGEGGGLNGEVQFEKVGWGRWDARLKGHASRRSRHGQSSLSPPPSLSGSFSGAVGVPISGHVPSYTRTRLPVQNSSWAEGSDAVFSHDSDEDRMMLEDIADKMSLDGNDEDGSASCSSSPEEDHCMEDDPNDATDEEDWSAIGAAALRSSYAASGVSPRPGSNFFPRTGHFYPNYYSSHIRVPISTLAKSAPMFVHRKPTYNHANINEIMNTGTGFKGNHSDLSFGVGDQQEREAVEALLRLGSV